MLIRSLRFTAVKLFYLPSVSPSKRCSHTREALDLVLRELQVSSINLLIVSFLGISFDADDDSFETEPSQSEIDEWITTYRTLEELYDQKRIKKIGLAEFGTVRLSKL